MSSTFLLGIVVVSLSGLIMGTSPWPLKLMRHFQYEHFAFVSMLLALMILPWTITLLFCPQPFAALSEVKGTVLLKANLFAFSWGIAQVLAMLCFLRIGVSLTYGILCSIGAAVGVITPMIFKASGVFGQAADLNSKPGMIMLAGTAIMIVGVVFASLAGLGREKMQSRSSEKGARSSGKFAVGLAMVVVAGVLSTGWGAAFSYSQDSIIAAMKAHGAADFPAGIAVWAVALLGAAVPNICYPMVLMTRNRNWSVLAAYPREIALALIYGLLFFVPSALLGQGMLLLGSLGASLGWGLVQGTLILGGQMLGFASGEWRGVLGKPRLQIYLAIVVLIVAMVVMALAQHSVRANFQAELGRARAENSLTPRFRRLAEDEFPIPRRERGKC
jgi:L-rhamnose-H+ transport protein